MLELTNHQADIAFSYAPGKLILVGEHAVVYGAKAIAMPIEQGIRVAISKLDSKSKKIGPMFRGMGPFFLGDTYLDKESSSPLVLRQALSYLCEAFGPAASSMLIVIDGSIPPGCGLGSSAALSVALIRAIVRFLSLSISGAELESHVMALETIFHGRPSGIDQTVVINGQSIGFRYLDGKRESWPISLATSLSLAVAISGPHEGTRNAVKELAERKRRQEQSYHHIFAGLNQVASKMEEALYLGRKACIGELMNIAQGYLNALSVSTPEIEKLCSLARDRGALGAKLTGAGGGGAVIALCDGNEKEVLSAFRAAGYQAFTTAVH
jgi:hydroxymethylglutaryl-CoA reductase